MSGEEKKRRWPNCWEGKRPIFFSERGKKSQRLRAWQKGIRIQSEKALLSPCKGSLCLPFLATLSFVKESERSWEAGCLSVFPPFFLLPEKLEAEKNSKIIFPP